MTALRTLLLGLPLSGVLLAQSVELSLTGYPELHVVRPGDTLSVTVEPRAEGLESIRARWIGPQGKPLGPVLTLPCNAPTQLERGPLQRGWVGLTFWSDAPQVSFPPQAAGQASRTYGFAVLPERPRVRALDADSPFGMVHGRREDPYLGPHLKTLTWHTTGADWWNFELKGRRDQGMIELPLLSGEDWDTDGHAPVDAAALDRLEDRFRRYCAADPTNLYWELGVEENLGQRYTREKHYLANLQRKAARVRQVAHSICEEIELVYNVEGFHYGQVERLLDSGAFAPFDVFSSHPYRWQHFESPEGWLPDHLRKLRSLLDARGFQDRPIWLTEIGLPVRGNNDRSGFFGYPDKRVALPGVTPDHYAVYLLKAHLVAIAEGVERIYWYNYQNRGNDVHYAEDHFALRAYTADGSIGDPLPAYATYATLVMALDGRAFECLERPDEHTWLFVFRGADGRRTWIGWSEGTSPHRIPWPSLAEGLEPAALALHSDVYGAPLKADAAGLTLGPRPTLAQQ